MIVLQFTPFSETLPRGNAEGTAKLSRLTESAFNVNAAIWTATTSIEIAAIACRTPTLASAAVAIGATLAAAAAVGVIAVEVANLADFLNKGGELTPADIEKANEILDMMMEPLDEIIAAAEKFVTGSQSGSSMAGVLEAIKDAREVFAKSSNPFERAAALTEIKEAVKDMLEKRSSPPPGSTPVPQPESAPAPMPPSAEPRDFNDFGSHPGPPMAGEPYRDPNTAYA